MTNHEFGITELMEIGTGETSWLITNNQVVFEVYNNKKDAIKLLILLNKYWRE